MGNLIEDYACNLELKTRDIVIQHPAWLSLIYTQSNTVSIIRQPTQSKGIHTLDFSNGKQTKYPYSDD